MTANDIDAMNQTIARVIDALGEEEGAIDKFLSVATSLEKVLDHVERKAMAAMLKELFGVYNVIPQNMDFMNVASMMKEKKVDMLAILGKIKQARERSQPPRTGQSAGTVVVPVPAEPRNEPAPLKESQPTTVNMTKLKERIGNSLPTDRIDDIVNSINTLAGYLDSDEKINKIVDDSFNFLINNGGLEITRTYNGKFDYFAASLLYISYRKVFSNDPSMNITKKSFYMIFGHAEKNCFRSLKTLKEAGHAAPEST